MRRIQHLAADPLVPSPHCTDMLNLKEAYHCRTVNELQSDVSLENYDLHANANTAILEISTLTHKRETEFETKLPTAVIPFKDADYVMRESHGKKSSTKMAQAVRGSGR